MSSKNTEDQIVPDYNIKGNFPNYQGLLNAYSQGKQDMKAESKVKPKLLKMLDERTQLERDDDNEEMEKRATSIQNKEWRDDVKERVKEVGEVGKEKVKQVGKKISSVPDKLKSVADGTKKQVNKVLGPIDDYFEDIRENIQSKFGHLFNFDLGPFTEFVHSIIIIIHFPILANLFLSHRKKSSEISLSLYKYDAENKFLLTCVYMWAGVIFLVVLYLTIMKFRSKA